MSLEFNRRSFLKYSAAAAVAVAGSSLLVGCGEDEYQKTGKIGSTLKLMGTFKTYKSTDAANAGKAPAFTLNSGSTDTGTFTCTVNIKCTTKKVPLYVTNECFELTVTHNKTEKNYAKQYITITDPEFDLKESEEAKDFKLTINNVTIKEGDKVDLKYWPRIQASSGNSGYTRAFCTWKMTAKKDATTGKITLECSLFCTLSPRLTPWAFLFAALRHSAKTQTKIFSGFVSCA